MTNEESIGKIKKKIDIPQKQTEHQSEKEVKRLD